MAAYDKKRLLAVLRPMPKATGARISKDIIAGFHLQPWHRGELLAYQRGSGRHLRVDRPDVSLMTNHFASEKRMVFAPEGPSGAGRHTAMVNDALMGGKEHPVLMGVFGLLIGKSSPVSGLAWSIVTTALESQKTTHRVLVREGDELWQTELVGKKGEVVYHSKMHWIVDPFRIINGKQGFAIVIHEDRKELTLDYV
jgi:hypothetical protein